MGLFSALERTDKPKYKKVKEEGCVVTVAIEVPGQQVDDEAQNALVRLQQRARLPGFRPGKAPLDLVKKQFWGHAREEAMDALLRRFVPEALRELKLSPVAAPTVSDAKLEPGKAARFEVKVEVAPAVAPRDYTKISVKRSSYPASDEALDARLAELREANARLERDEAEVVGKEHYVVVDYAGFQDGKPLPNAKGDNELVDISSEQTLEGLAEGLVGAKRGEQREVPIKIAGKPAALKVTVKELKRKVLPALDDELGKDLGFQTLAELKAKLREVIEEEGRSRTEREVTQQIEEALLKANKIPVPPVLVEAQLESLLDRARRQILGPRGQFNEGQLAELREKLRPRAEDEVRISYLLPAIAEKEKLAAKDEEISAELDRAVAAAETDAKKDEVRKFFAERREAIAGMIRDRKTLQFLREKASITDNK